MLVSIIIVNYNTNIFVINCISSIIQNTSLDGYEIIVVDNASPDDDPKDIIREYPDVKLLEMNTNFGFGRACNEGIRISSSEHVLLLNPDTLVKNDAVSKLYTYLINNNDVGAVGGWLKDEKGNIMHSYDKFFNPKMKIWNELKFLFKKAFFLDKLVARRIRKNLIEDENITEVDYITGADLMFPRSTWEKLGGIPEEYFMYFEEQDFQFQMSKIGFKRVLVPHTFIVHFHSKSIKSPNYKRILITKASFVFVKKYFKSNAIWYKYVTVFNLILNSIIDIYRREHTLKENITLIKSCLCT